MEGYLANYLITFAVHLNVYRYFRSAWVLCLKFAFATVQKYLQSCQTPRTSVAAGSVGFRFLTLAFFVPRVSGSRLLSCSTKRRMVVQWWENASSNEDAFIQLSAFGQYSSPRESLKDTFEKNLRKREQNERKPHILRSDAHEKKKLKTAVASLYGGHIVLEYVLRFFLKYPPTSFLILTVRRWVWDEWEGNKYCSLNGDWHKWWTFVDRHSSGLNNSSIT